MTDQQNFRILRLAEVCAKLQVAKSTVYNWMDFQSKYFNPNFPRPVKLGQSSVGWLESEVHQFLLERIAERDSAGRS